MARIIFMGRVNDNGKLYWDVQDVSDARNRSGTRIDDLCFILNLEGRLNGPTALKKVKELLEDSECQWLEVKKTMGCVHIACFQEWLFNSVHVDAQRLIKWFDPKYVESVEKDWDFQSKQVMGTGAWITSVGMCVSSSELAPRILDVSSSPKETQQLWMPPVPPATRVSLKKFQEEHVISETMRIMDIQPGDVVQLKSGGPIMTVESVDPDFGVACRWTDENRPYRQYYEYYMLTKVADPDLAKVDSATTQPPPPVEITNSLKKFKAKYPDERKTAFIMMRYGKTQAHSRIAPVIKEALKTHSIIGLRADDGKPHTDLYWNILTYIYGCGFGIAVFERIEKDDFNPNVAFEAGFMMALGKPVLLLKDNTLQSLHADLNGKLYEEFDTRSLKKTIPGVVVQWLKENGFA
jgi:uncharacterized protein YodC (DUF2158 family)/nucleoside 2-deoxyribosyltransferase